MVRTQKIGTSGNSLCVRIPRPLARVVGVVAGALAIVEATDGVLTVRPTTEAALKAAALDLTRTAGPEEFPAEVSKARRVIRQGVKAALRELARRRRPRGPLGRKRRGK